MDIDDHNQDKSTQLANENETAQKKEEKEEELFSGCYVKPVIYTYLKSTFVIIYFMKV